MKKLTRSLIVAGLVASSLGAYAATPTGAGPFQVMVPNLKSGFDFTVAGLLLQPTNSDLVYSSTTTLDSTGDNYTTNSTSLTPNYDFGFGIGAGYIFPNSGNDVRANWTHFDHDTSDSVAYGAGNAVSSALGFGIPFYFGPVGASLDGFGLDSAQTVNSSSDVSFQYDAVDLDVGQYISIGTRLQTRLFAGLRYANLENDVTDTYVFNDTAFIQPGSTLFTNQTSVESFDSEFTGIGPRVGIDASYHLADCFGFTAHAATALLVGRVESSTTQVATNTYTTAANPNADPATPGSVSYTTSNNTYTTDNQTRVVPAFDAKLGMDYTLGFNNDTSHMVIEAGYQVTQYVDAIDRLYNGYTTTSGVGFNGPFLSLNFKI